MFTYPARQTRWVSLLTLGLMSTAVVADESLYLNEQDFFTDIPEITSATRLSQKLTESPASISILTREMIEASGALNIPDLLRLVPGFQSTHVSANKFATTYHGASDNFPRRLEVMIDGRSVYLPLLATVDWTSLGINLRDIERIEVVRGSNVPSQGSNAFLGSINIITREPALEQGGYVDMTAGSLNTANLHASHSGVLANWSYRLSGGHEQNDDFDIHENKLKRNYLSFSGSYTPSLSETWRFQAGIDRGYSYVGGADKADEPYVRRDHDSHYQSATYENIYSHTGSLKLQAFHNYLDLETPLSSRDYLINEEGIPEPLVDEFMQLNTLRRDNEHGTTEVYDIEAQIQERLANIKSIAGLGYRYQTAESDILLQEGKVSEQRWRLFGHLDWSLHPQWLFNTGAMYEYSSAESDALSYRHALIYQPDTHSSVRLGYSLTERIGSLLERYQNSTVYAPAAFAAPFDEPTVYDFNRRTNPELGTERNETWELGYYLNMPQQAAYLDARLFHEKLSSMIDTFYVGLPADSPDTDNPKRVGIGDNRFGWTNEGVELQFKQQPSADFWYLLNYAYTNTRVDTWYRGARGGSGILTFQGAVTPEHTASLMMNWSPLPDLNLSLMHYYMGKTDWFEGGYRASYNRTDLRAAHTWQLDASSELEAAVTVQNAFGPEYAEFYEHNLFDRRYWLQLTLRYH